MRLGYTLQGAAVRVVNGAGDGLPGLTIDSYSNTLLVEVTSYGMAQRINLLDEVVSKHLPGYRRLFFASEETITREQMPPLPTTGREVSFGENGLLFQLAFDPQVGTGFPIAQRENRKLTARWATGRRVLDLFSQQGGFALSSLAAGAVNALAVDHSEDHLFQADMHAERNGLSLQQQRADVYEFLDHLTDDVTFDLILCHPPKMPAAGRKLKKALEAYDFLIDRCIAHLSDHGVLMLSSQISGIGFQEMEKAVLRCCKRRDLDVDLLLRSGLPADHPRLLNQDSEIFLNTILVERRSQAIDAHLAAMLATELSRQQD